MGMTTANYLTPATTIPNSKQRGFLLVSPPTKENEGQAVIEFLFVLSFSFGLIYLFLQQNISVGKSMAVHYGTFMASRVYLTYDSGAFNTQVSEAAAQELAQKEFSSLDLPGISIRGATLRLNAPGGNIPFEFVGAFSDFTSRVNSFASIGGDPFVTLRSESFLGREPTRYECFERIKYMIKKLGENVEGLYTAYDDGC
jgi:hypothetical protein